MSLGKNIQFLRKQKKITQEQFAEMLGVSRQAVSRWESDEIVPELTKITQMGEIFSCKLDALIYEGMGTTIRFAYSTTRCKVDWMGFSICYTGTTESLSVERICGSLYAA